MARTQPTGPWYFTPRLWMAERCVGSLWEPLIDWQLMNLPKGISGILCFCRFAPRSSQCVWKPWKILEPRGFQRLQWVVASCETRNHVFWRFWNSDVSLEKNEFAEFTKPLSFSSQAVLGSVWCLSDSVAALELFTFVAWRRLGFGN